MEGWLKLHGKETKWRNGVEGGAQICCKLDNKKSEGTWFLPTSSSTAARESSVAAAGPDFLFNQETIVSAVRPPMY